MSFVSVIIATKDREPELRRCLESLWLQSRLPQEVIIIDDGLLDPRSLEERVPEGVKFQYHRKSSPGVSGSRNLGAKVAKGDLLLFLDDDVVLEADFLEQILKVFEQDPFGETAGVSGVIINKRPKPRWFRPLAKFFFLEGKKPGGGLPWGFFSEYEIPKETIEVEWIPGGLSCFRKSVFEKFAFSDMNQKGRHGLADVEFSWRVSRHYKLKVSPYARVSHYPPVKNPREFLERGRRQLLNHGLIFVTHGKPNPSNWLRFLWACIGITLGNLGASMLLSSAKEKKARFFLALGNVLGLLEFLSKRE